MSRLSATIGKHGLAPSWIKTYSLEAAFIPLKTLSDRVSPPRTGFESRGLLILDTAFL